MNVEQMMISGYIIPTLVIDGKINDVNCGIGKSDLRSLKSHDTLGNDLSTLKSFLRQNQDEDCVIVKSIHLEKLSDLHQNEIINNILVSAEYGVKLLLGNAIEVGQCIPLTRDLFWIDKFKESSFIVIFNTLFETIIRDELNTCDHLMVYLSEVTSQKILFVPFLPVGAHESYVHYTHTEAQMNAAFLLKQRFGKGI